MSTMNFAPRAWNKLVTAVRAAETDFATINWSDNPAAYDAAKARKNQAYAVTVTFWELLPRQSPATRSVFLMPFQGMFSRSSL